MKKLILMVCCIGLLLLSAVFAIGAEPVLKVGDRLLVQASKYDTVHEATIIKATKKGDFVKISHGYNMGNPQVVWERTDDFRKSVIERLEKR